MARSTTTSKAPRRVIGYVRISKDRDDETSTTTQEQAIEHLEKVRWHGQPHCPYCGSIAVGRHASGDRDVPRWQCRDCTRAFAVTVGTLFHGVVVYDGMTWTAFDQTNSGLPDDQIRSITIDHRNWAWVGTYLGAACYTGSEWRLYNDQPTSYNGLVMNGSVINDVAVREDGLVAIATLNGGFHYLTDTCIHYHSTFTDFFPDNTQTAVAFDPNLDQRWIATPSHGLIRHFDDWYSGLYFVYSTQSSTIPSNGLTSLAMDALGRPWMGSNYAGVFYRSEDGSFTTYNSANSGLPDNTISSVIFAPDGTLWVGTFYGGAARLTFPMGILEPSRKVALDVYPNPTSERAWVNWPHGSFGATWRLMDVTGKVEKEGTIGADGWSELDLIGLSPGIHLLQVPSNGLYSQARLVVY